MGSPPIITLALILSTILIWTFSIIITFQRCYNYPYKECYPHFFELNYDRVCDFILQEFIWDPYQTSSVWRYFTYPLNNITFYQMLINVFIYITLGVPFEMVFGSGRTALLLVVSAGLGSFISSLFKPGAFIIGGSVFLQFFLFAQIFSRTLHLGQNSTKTIEFVFFSNFLYFCLIILDYVYNFYFWIQTRGKPKPSIAKIGLSYIPTYVGSLMGVITGVIIMTGYRRSPLKQIFLESMFYTFGFAFMIICVILKLTGLVATPSCLDGYVSDMCSPLGCKPLATNQDI